MISLGLVFGENARFGLPRSVRRLGGFGLDPLYEEPGRSNDELLKFDNVVISPHIAAQPRFNALNDLADMMESLSNVLAEQKSK